MVHLDEKSNQPTILASQKSSKAKEVLTFLKSWIANWRRKNSFLTKMPSGTSLSRTIETQYPGNRSKLLTLFHPYLLHL